MKIWAKVCMGYILSLTFIILIASLLILFLPVYTGDQTINGFNFIKENGFKEIFPYAGKYHQYIEEMFNPRFDIDGEGSIKPGALYFSSGINLLIVAFPIFVFISFLVVKKMTKVMNYPIPEKFKELQFQLKKERKSVKKEFKEKIKNESSKQKAVTIKNNLKKELLEFKRKKFEIKYQIKLDYKLKRKHIIKSKSEKNEV